MVNEIIFIKKEHSIIGETMKYTNIRSDLANESLEQLQESKHYRRSIYQNQNITVESFDILKEHPSINQKVGRYIEISFEDYHDQNTIIEEVAKNLKEMIPKKQPRILIVGLGNQYLTSDAIGPRTLRDIRITHFLEEELRNEYHYYDILGISPGVMVQTGMESCDIIKGIVAKEKVDLVIVVDALCAKNYNKLSHVIQINNVGIYPGGGIGNNRKAMNKETLQTDVIAIGVPTVIHASSLVNEVIQTTIQYFGDQLNRSNVLKIGKRKKYEGDLTLKQKEMMLGQIGTLQDDQLELLFHEILNPIESNYVFSDKQIDEQCEILSKIIAKSINSLRY